RLRPSVGPAAASVAHRAPQRKPTATGQGQGVRLRRAACTRVAGRGGDSVRGRSVARQGLHPCGGSGRHARKRGRGARPVPASPGGPPEGGGRFRFPSAPTSFAGTEGGAAPPAGRPWCCAPGGGGGE